MSSTTSSMATCPACSEKRVKSRFSWRAILYAILCFPCGIYCCLRRRSYYCTRCECDVVKRLETRAILANQDLGYNYRLYEATKTGLPANFSAYRNPAMTVSSTDSTVSTTLSTAPIVP